MLEKFSLAKLASLDSGRVAAAFDAALRRAQDDCKDRPALEEARTITLTLNALPVIDETEGEMHSVNLQFHITEKLPKRKSKTYNMLADDAGLYVNELAPDDARQLTLDTASSSGGGPRKVVAGAR